MEKMQAYASPQAIAETAVKERCKSIAFTYNDPVIFAEYAIDTAKACQELGIKTVAVTAGYIHALARKDFFQYIDAVNVDLKAFTDEFYYKLTGSHLQPVLDTLLYLKNETKVWVEITTLLIPGKNDSNEEITALSQWIKTNLGADVPLHFSAFHPDHKLSDIPATPVATLKRARQIALKQGLNYVYTGNIIDVEGDSTYCPKCHEAVIIRDWYKIIKYKLTTDAQCPNCGTKIAGHFDAQAQNFGAKRIPIKINKV